jgi:hypothetical protein
MPTTRVYHRHQHWQTAGEGLSTGAAFGPLAKRQAGRKDSVGDRGGHHPRLYLLARHTDLAGALKASWWEDMWPPPVTLLTLFRSWWKN